MGIIVFAFSGDWFMSIMMYLAPSGIWLWGAMFLIPGSLPTSGLSEETQQVVSKHTVVEHDNTPIDGSDIKKFIVGIGRKIRRFYNILHWLYIFINFTIHMKVIRIISSLKGKTKQT